MIHDNGGNPRTLIEHLNKLSDGKSIEEYIVPVFSRYGFRTSHFCANGASKPPEFILSKCGPLHNNEGIIIADVDPETVTASCIQALRDQISLILAVYSHVSEWRDPKFVFFTNHVGQLSDSRRTCTDTHLGQNVYALSRESVYALICNSGVGPKALLHRAVSGNPIDEESLNVHIYDVLMSDDPREVDRLLNHEVRLVRTEVSSRMQRMIIDFVKNKLDQTAPGNGIIRPMRWLDDYFDFFNQKQYCYLIRVIAEHTSSYCYSDEASRCIAQVFKKIEPKHIAGSLPEFIRTSADVVLEERRNWHDVVRLASCYKRGYFGPSTLSSIVEWIAQYGNAKQKAKSDRDLQEIGRLRHQVEYSLRNNRELWV